MIFAKPWADALIVLLVVLLFFGPKRLPALGKSLGEGMREFKDSITGHSKSAEEDERPALTPAATTESPAPAPESASVASPEPRP
ncbi:MAG TPA: twin-arginine translocase TatA/TatE family subunit [Solirubrobacteraceae bacterium]|nr:twin-arginine translocase TatA/TatE family subunit [Solirubrobacteraceae bacterium]